MEESTMVKINREHDEGNQPAPHGVPVKRLVMQNKVGDRVEIIRTDIFNLRHTKRPWVGFITNIDGSYISVRPTRCKWIIELYPNEIKPA